MTSKLFILMKSPWACPDCTDMNLVLGVKGNDRVGIILFEDAAYFAAHKEMAARLSPVMDEIFVMRDDLEARGFGDSVPEGFRVIDYPEAVDMIFEYDKTITVW